MIVSTASPAWSGQAAARGGFKAVFDFLVLFNANSVVPDAERVSPGRGRELTTLWRKEDVVPDTRSAGAHITSRRADVASGFRRTPTTSK
jgi:hypothetical protein